MLQVRGRQWRADISVYDRRHYDLKSLVDALLPPTDYLIVERYQNRPVGHQAWSTGETQQLIGALRYAAECRKVECVTVATGDPDKELPQLLIGPYIERWNAHWPHPKRRDWHHGRAAWRVLARFMLSKYTDLWSALAAPAALASLTKSADAPLATPRYPDNLHAPSAVWHT